MQGEGATVRQALRNEVLAERDALPHAYRAHKSSVLCSLLQDSLELTLGVEGVPPEQAIVAVYQAFRAEVDLSDFIAWLYERKAHVAFPCLVGNAHAVPSPAGVVQTMEMRLVTQEQFAAGPSFLANPLLSFTHNSPDLAAYPYVSAHDLTMVVVPVVAFDKHGNRLGYGGGNYDRYLTQLLPACRRTGVAFAEQEVAEVPTQPHDIALPILAR